MKRVWLAAFVVGCGGTTAPSAVAPTASAAPEAHRAWSYSGDTGPATWGDLDPSFGACKTGTAQSPVDLPPSPAHRQPGLAKPRWEPVPLKITNTGHSIQVDDGASSSLVVDGTEYKLAQLHFHSPAEHTMGGRRFELEMHLVHKSADGKVAVVAILFGTGAENAVLAPLWSAMPGQPRPAVAVAGATLDVSSLLPAAPKYLRYGGSLTAPPCTEGVTWLVIEPDAASQVSAEQVRKMKAATQPATNRPVQPLGAREVVELGP
jgi:carbonic anhydrase